MDRRWTIFWVYLGLEYFYTYSFIQKWIYLLSLAQPKMKWIGPYCETQRNNNIFTSINNINDTLLLVISSFIFYCSHVDVIPNILLCVQVPMLQNLSLTMNFRHNFFHSNQTGFIKKKGKPVYLVQSQNFWTSRT